MPVRTVYANKKTKKYHAQKRGDQCRQREILPKNLEKFGGTVEAEHNGYKPCKACYPD